VIPEYRQMKEWKYIGGEYCGKDEDKFKIMSDKAILKPIRIPNVDRKIL